MHRLRLSRHVLPRRSCLCLLIDFPMPPKKSNGKSDKHVTCYTFNKVKEPRTSEAALKPGTKSLAELAAKQK